MGYFPFYIDIKDRRCVIVGGGKVACRKLRSLLPFSPRITVIAPEICAEIRAEHSVTLIERCFCTADLNGAFIVISATGDQALNTEIYELCCQKRILVNTVDAPEQCGFLFPALVHRGDITVGISTAGKAPLYARYLREQTEDLLDDFQLGIADILSRYRPVIRQMFDTEQKRKRVAETLLHLCLSENELPDDGKICDMLERMRTTDEDSDRNAQQ